MPKPKKIPSPKVLEARRQIGELAAKLDVLALSLSMDEMSAAMDAARTLHLLEHGYVMRLVNADTGEAR